MNDEHYSGPRLNFLNRGPGPLTVILDSAFKLYSVFKGAVADTPIRSAQPSETPNPLDNREPS